EIAVDDESWNHWSALKIMVKHNWESEFCHEKSLKYLKSKNEKFGTDALSILFSLNSPFAINYLMEYMRKGDFSAIRYLNLKNYNFNCEDDILREMYFMFYSDKIDTFDSHQARSFFFNYLVNIGVKGDNFKRINSL